MSYVAKADEIRVTNNNNGDNTAVAVTTDTNENVISNNVIKNGWQQNNDQTWTYYTNGQVKAGKDYAKLPTINGTGENWYLVNNGVAQAGIQEWAGSYWNFDQKTYLLTHQRGRVKSQWGLDYVAGEDGRIQSGVQVVNNQIYDLDPSTYLLANRLAYAQANNGKWYLVDHGHAQNGVQKWAGSYWYFDPNTYLLRTKKDYIKS